LTPLREEIKNLKLIELPWMLNSKLVIKARNKIKIMLKRSDNLNLIRSILINRTKILSSNYPRQETQSLKLKEELNH
jgi:hypothetical protein